MKSLMQRIGGGSKTPPAPSGKEPKKDSGKKTTSKEKKASAKKTSKEKKHHAPAPSIMGPPPGAGTTQADAMGLSTKKGGGGASRRKRAKPSLPGGKPGGTVMIPVAPEQLKPRSDREVAAPTCAQPLNGGGRGGERGTPVAVSPSPSPSPATSPHTTNTPAESPNVFELKEVDLPMEPADAIFDPEKETRPITGRDPEVMTPEQLCNLKAFISQFEQLGVQGLMKEFDTIKGYNLQPFDITAHQGNPTKNRYQDIFCIDPTRVRLMDGKEGEYIHANYVKGVPFLNNFITTQGPLEPTVNDFWRLVVQENVGYIFMLCSIVELGKRKCEPYIPEAEGETRFYEDIKVTVEKKQEDSHFINTKLVLEAPNKPKRYLYHHYWKNWPDRGVPITALAGLRLLRHARLTTSSTIVHCSAGVGRTGTLVAIEWLLQRILTSAPPYDMREMLRAVRNQRAHAIQTAPQYAYVCFAVFRLFTLIEPNNTAAFHKFSQDMQAYAGVVLPPPPGAAPAAPGPGGPPATGVTPGAPAAPAEPHPPPPVQ